MGVGLKDLLFDTFWVKWVNYMNLDQARFNMVEQQIRTWQVLDLRVLDALQKTKREIFTPLAYQDMAYSDTEIPLSSGQLMLAPSIGARLVHDLHLTGSEKVLEIGTGSGYSTALLASLCKRVISIECDAELALNAKANLQKASIGNAEVRVGDGLQGSPAEGPFEAIVLQGSVPEIPQQLLDQLQINGRLIAVVGEEPVMQTCLVTRHGTDSFTHKVLWDTVIPRLQGVHEPSAFHF